MNDSKLWETMKKSYQKLSKFAVFGFLFVSYAIFPLFLTGTLQTVSPDEENSPVIMEGVRTSSPSGWLHIYQDNWSAGGFAGSGTPEDPYVIENLEINGEDLNNGILVEFSNAYFIIRNCTFSNIGALNSGQAGIKLVNTTRGIIQNNSFIANFGGNYGIHLINNSHFNNLEENIIQGFRIGILLQTNCTNNSINENSVKFNTFAGIYSNWTGTAKYNDANNFTNNVIQNNSGDGIYLNRSQYCVLTNNFICNNSGDGITVRTGGYNQYYYNYITNNSGYGLLMSGGSWTNVSFNIIRNNSYSGLDLSSIDFSWITNNTFDFNLGAGIITMSSDYNLITKNQMFNNSYGISLSLSYNSKIHKNYFGGNNYENAFDSSAGGNLWNTSTAGNYWTNYTGSDVNNDGIGDTAHSFSGEVDSKPIMGDPFYNGSGIFLNGTATQGPTCPSYVLSRFWCDGSGTTVDPIVIKNLVVNGWNQTRGIAIASFSSPYRIENCTIFNASAKVTYDSGIYLSNADNGTVINNRIFNNGYYGGTNNASGISISTGSSNINVTNNHVYNNTGNGIWVTTSSYINVSNNLIENHSWCNGISFQSTDNSTIAGNLIQNNGKAKGFAGYAQGLYMINSETNNVTGNQFIGNSWYALYFSGGNKWNRFTRNIFNEQDDGDTVGNFSTGNVYNQWNDSVCGNYWGDYTGPDADDDGIGDNPKPVPNSIEVDYKPIYEDGFNKSAIIIDDQAANNWVWARTRIWCSGSGTAGDPYFIKDLIINGKFSTSGIDIQNSSAYFVLQNVTVQNVSTAGLRGGIYLWNATNGIINASKIQNNLDFGIILRHSANTTLILSNTITNNSVGGIYVDGHCYNSTLQNNTIRDNLGCGILLANDAGNHTIRDNLIFNSTLSGILLSTNVGNNTLINNTISRNNADGIRIWTGSSDNELWGNVINNNTGDGINFNANSRRNHVGTNFIENNTNRGIAIDDSSNDNQIHVNNTFRANLINARDDGTGNSWHNGSLGNYWADYSGFDTNGNGIGETSYNIPGLASSKDFYPIWTISDVVAPIITIIEPNPSFLFGIPAPQFNITVEEYILEEIWYTLDGGVSNFFISQFNGTLNQTAWEARPNGTLMVRFYARDNASLIGFKDVIVQLDKIAPSIGVQKPIANNHYGANAPTIELSVNDANIGSIWYNLDGGTNFTIGSMTTLINQIAWDALPERTVTITIYANDTLGNVNSYTITIVKDLAVDDAFPWWLQAILAGLISTLVGIMLRSGINARKDQKQIIAKMQENSDKIDNLGLYLESNMDPVDWEKFKSFWNMYQNREISRKELLVRGQKAMGKRFTKLLADQEQVQGPVNPPKGYQAGEKPAGSAASLVKTLSVEKGGTPPPVSQAGVAPRQSATQATIQQIDAHIAEMYNMVKTLDEKFARGEVSQEVFLKKKTELAEKIGELQGNKEQMLEKK